jgi:ABC-type phosphate transport system substrate-binding protein
MHCNLKLISAVLSLALSMSAFATAWAQSDRLVLHGDGSSFAYPMSSKWIEEYEKENPDVRLTYISNGSGVGIHDIMMGSVDFAGTDAPLKHLRCWISSPIAFATYYIFPRRSARTCRSTICPRSPNRLISHRRRSWMLLPSVMPDPEKGAEMIKFLQWGLARGQDYLEPLSYARLPNEVIAREQKVIKQIKNVDAENHSKAS